MKYVSGQFMKFLIYEFVSDDMDIDSLYDYGDEEQDFYEESPGCRKGYPIDHRALKVRRDFSIKIIHIYI